MRPAAGSASGYMCTVVGIPPAAGGQLEPPSRLQQLEVTVLHWQMPVVSLGASNCPADSGSGWQAKPERQATGMTVTNLPLRVWRVQLVFKRSSTGKQNHTGISRYTSVQAFKQA
jgi:hypothetical protein